MVLPLLPLLVLVSGQAPPAPPPQQAPAVVAPAGQARPARKLYNETADAKAAIETALKAAAEDDIRVLVNWGANDDERCAKFADARRAPEISDPGFFSDEYRLVYVDVGHLDKNMDLAQAYAAKPAAAGLPYFTVLDKSGKVLAGASASEFASEADPTAIAAKKLAAFLTAHQAAAPDADPPFKAALSQAKKDGKYVFLWFSAPW
jgi:hypothetical protein